MTPEVRLLVGSLRVEFGIEPASSLEDLAGAVTDWELVRRLARAHTMTPALVRALDAGSWGGVPLGEGERIRSLATQRVADALRITGTLVEVTDLLERAGVPHLPYKGPSLAVQLFGDPGAREFVDLDVLVPRRHLGPALVALRAGGFDRPLELSPEQMRRYVAYANELQLVGADGTTVEVQWALGPRSAGIPLTVEELLARSGRLEVAGKEVPALNQADLLVVLSYHAGKHLWERLGWVRDMATVLARTRHDEALEALAVATSSGTRRALAVGVLLTSSIVGVPIPEPLESAAAEDAVAVDLAARIRHKVLDPSRAVAAPDKPLDLIGLRMREGVGARSRYLIRLAVTPTLEDWRARDLPERFGFLYYAVRPFRLAGKYVFRRM